MNYVTQTVVNVLMELILDVIYVLQIITSKEIILLLRNVIIMNLLQQKIIIYLIIYSDYVILVVKSVLEEMLKIVQNVQIISIVKACSNLPLTNAMRIPVLQEVIMFLKLIYSINVLTTA